jgi:tetratricopeptide (TPR) repeat protein
VLVGTAAYRTLPALPSVANNLQRLKALLQDPDLWGIPARNCTVLPNPRTVDEVLDATHNAAQRATDALVVYYAGHGLVEPDTFNLFLALAESDITKLHKAVRYEDVRREVMKAPAQPARVVLLDCCFSGQAMLGGMTGTAEVADRVRIDGTYLMTASAETAIALAPADEEYTAFTGELIRVLEHGIPNGPDLLDLESVYWAVRDRLVAKHRPVPQQRVRNDGSAIALVRNRSGTVPSAVPAPPRPVRSPDMTYRLTRARRDLASAVARLYLRRALGLAPRNLLSTVSAVRATGVPADDLLRLVGHRRPDQEVAAILQLIRRTGPATDTPLVLSGAATRTPGEVVALLGALAETGLAVETEALLSLVAREPASRVAAVVNVLATQPGETLLQAAVRVRLNRPEEMTGLLQALWEADLRDQAAAVLKWISTGMRPEGIAAVADALMRAGHTAAAFGLYDEVPGILLKRPAPATAALARELVAAGRGEQAQRLVEAATERAGTAGKLADLVESLEEADLQLFAGAAVTSAAHGFPDGEVAVLATELRQRGRAEAALDLYVQAAATRPAATTVWFAAGLYEAGRPLDANRLLEDAGHRRPPEDVAHLVGALVPDHGVAVPRVLAAAAHGGADRIAALVKHLPTQHLPTMIDIVRGREVDTLVPVARILHERGHPKLARNVLDLAFSDTPQAISAAGLGMDPATAARIIAMMLLDSPTPNLAVAPAVQALDGSPALAATARHLVTILSTRPSGALGTAMSLLREIGADPLARALADAAAHAFRANLPDALATFDASKSKEMSRLLGAFARKASVTEVATTVRAMHEHLQGENALRLARIFRKTHPHGLPALELAWRLQRDGYVRERNALLVDRRWLPLEAAQDLLSLAVAEVLHGFASSVPPGHAYPVERTVADRVRSWLRLTDEAEILLVLGGMRDRAAPLLAFTANGVHAQDGGTLVRRRSTLTYADFPEIEFRDLGHQQLGLSLAGRNEIDTWRVPPPLSNRQVLNLVHAIRRTAHEVPDLE